MTTKDRERTLTEMTEENDDRGDNQREGAGNTLTKKIPTKRLEYFQVLPPKFIKLEVQV